MKFNLRLLYLYLFSFVGLLIVVVGGIQLVNLGIKTFVFPNADIYTTSPMTIPAKDGTMTEIETQQQAEERQRTDIGRQRQRDLSNAVAMVLVGAPLYLYHWKTIQKEN
ncbi:hypothetical protein KBC75_05370 [Candidatus Shapirobacteria bacterium]|nr:hypothetical protein [Candidatus Shapirobacteria bacterium]